ncbi:hypothetical protein BUALT_Bualt19G0113700 [Buddleja alternifolia]|uniref:HTH myb-type domain-containing protein n=1 Tax=Buddleja alternifolia TaxID=168488 RepID=A0AAV6W2S3_9LAMI|nr:hypothetical protein BUALT_Bualt19G0113700 [Buddleja alternifolia]
MAPLIPAELSLDCRFSSQNWIPKTIGAFLAEISRIRNASEKIPMLDDYVNQLQDEMKKIDVFKRELPLSMLLLNDAIATVKEELMQCKKSDSEPVLEEFIPLKKISRDDKDEKIENCKEKDSINCRDKMNWMSSVQLWNSDTNYPNTNFSNNKPSLKLDNSKKRTAEEIDRTVMDDSLQSGKNRTVGKSSMPFKGCDELPGVLSLSMPVTKNSMDGIYSSDFISKTSCSRSGSSSGTNSQSNYKAGNHQTARKQRRCWSPELHRRFVSALQHLGGPQAATPKQIRELMQVDGLTNDEVKSHLQKYRIHAQRGTKNMLKEQCRESSKPSNSQSGSPHGPLHLDSMEDEVDGKSESHSWEK